MLRFTGHAFLSPPTYRLWLFPIVISAVIASGLVGCNHATGRCLTSKDQDIIDQVTDIHDTFVNLSPNSTGRFLAYIRAEAKGRCLFIADLSKTNTFALNLTNEVQDVYGWSPDDRYLAFSQISSTILGRDPDSDKVFPATWIMLFDSQTSKVRRISKQDYVVEGSFAWLPFSRCFFISSRFGQTSSNKWVFSLANGQLSRADNEVNDFVLTKGSTAAFFSDGEIESCPLDSTNAPPLGYITHFRRGAFTRFGWLRYSRDADCYLFVASPQASKYRHLYSYAPATQILTKLTDFDTYHGEWLEEGDGFACVENRSNQFILTVHSQAQRLCTNLFTNGSVANFAVSTTTSLIFITASVGVEPRSIWKYDINHQSLQKIISGTDRKLDAAQAIAPISKTVASDDGLIIPYFIWPPREVSGYSYSNGIPVILYIPAPTWQVTGSFDCKAELYSNLGYLYVGINYRGCDGYGAEFASLKDSSQQAKDVLAVRRALFALPHVDRKNVFLYSNSGGGPVVNELLRMSPGQWRGAVFDHTLPSIDLGGDANVYPPTLVVVGDRERVLPYVIKFEDVAEAAHLDVQVVVAKNCGHLNWYGKEFSYEQRIIADFLCQNTKR